MNSVIRFVAVVVGLYAAVFMSSAIAQEYPNRPVRIIVPQPPGGGVDFVARLIAEKLSEGLGQSFVVENRAGAGGMIGAGFVAKAAADGYTLLLDASTHVTSGFVYKAVPFDTIRDFTPITQITSTSYVVAVHPSVRATRIPDLSTVSPGQLHWGTAGIGSIDHLAVEALKSNLRIALAPVPYKGLSPAINDLVGGHIHGMVIPILPALPHIKGARIRALAVTSSIRSPALPDTPTVAESGIPGFEFSSWHGMWGPKGLPRDIAARIQSEVVKATRRLDVREKLPTGIFELIASTPDAFSRFIDREAAKYSKIIKDAKISAD